MNRAIKERRRPFNIGTQSSHYISILLYRVLWTVLREKKNVGKWKCKGTIRQLSCIKEIQLQLMSTWWALFLALYISIYKLFFTRQHSYWMIQSTLLYYKTKRWPCFIFLLNANLINYPEISWKITFAHP